MMKNRQIDESDRELEKIGLELALSLSEVFEALKKISSGDPWVRVDEVSSIELIAKLKHMINLTAENIGEIVDQSHEFAMVLAEHFDVLHRVSKGDLHARVSGLSRIELLESLKKVTNETIQSIEREITERKKAEETLLESEGKYRSLIENVNIGVYRNTAGDNGCFIQANPAMAKIFGYDSVEEFMKIHPADLYQNPEERKQFIAKIRKLGFVKDEELKLRKNDGSPIICSITASVQYAENDGIKWINGVLEDITERKHSEEERHRLEAQLLQAQKMEAVGQLAGGIAHDFNNLLTAIIGYGNLLKTEISKDDRLSSYTTQILNAAERAATLTNDLLTFSRKQFINPRPVNLNSIIREVENMLSRIIGEDIELKTVLSNTDLPVMADNTQIEQVLLNLATNARDAMPGGGSLIIRSERIELDNAFIKAHGYGKAGSYAVLSFEDTGMGMDEKIQKRIFEPFFTTKEVGKGTGLGLAMVYGIVKQHEGYINVYSEHGKGTSFKIYFPLIESQIIEKEPSAVLPLPTGTEIILLGEDDPHVRKFMKEVLVRVGYTIIEAVDGEDAINKFKENKDKVHLLLIDVVMPKKNGKEAYDEIKKLRPDLKAIFVSGYSAEVVYKKGILEEGMDFISKPVALDEFLTKVRETLDK